MYVYKQRCDVLPNTLWCSTTGVHACGVRSEYDKNIACLSCTSLAEASGTWQSHRITSSAWKRSVGGMVRPSASAVLRLITSSNFMGCSTGRSAGLAPFRILST